MGNNKSAIEWCTHTWNPWVGCTPCSPGCDHCWARRLEDGRLRRLRRCDGADFWNGPVFQGYEKLTAPLHWRRRKPCVVFVCSSSDLFHPTLSYGPARNSSRLYEQVFEVMAEASQHKFLILTKRGQAMYHILRHAKPMPNVALGVTACNQLEADGQLPWLAQLRKNGWHTFASFEPLLEPTIVPRAFMPQWVIVGAESGPHRRECRLEWVQELRIEARCDHVPLFVKQLHVNGKVSHDLSEWPEWARVRDVPDWAKVEG